MSNIVTLTEVKQNQGVDINKVTGVLKLLHKTSNEFRKENEQLYKENDKLKNDMGRLKEGVAPSVLDSEELKSVIDEITNDVKGWGKSIGRRSGRRAN